MYLRHTPSGDLVEVLSPDKLLNPCEQWVSGRFHCGEELQEPQRFRKPELAFPSGEPLPACWTDPAYGHSFA